MVGFVAYIVAEFPRHALAILCPLVLCFALSSGVMPSSQEALVDGQAPILAITVQHNAMEASPDNGTPIVDGSSARDEASHVDTTRKKKSRPLAWLRRCFCCFRKRKPKIDPQTAEVPWSCRNVEEEPTGDAMDESSAEDEGQPEEGPSQKKQKLSFAAITGSKGGKLSGKVGENRYKADTYRRTHGSRPKCPGKNAVSR